MIHPTSNESAESVTGRNDTHDKSKENACSLCKRPFRKLRSNNQNSYYHKCIVAPIANHIGENTNIVHDILKEKFLAPQFKTIDGVDYPLSKSTTRLTTVQQEDYHRDIRIWAQEWLNLTLALPNEQHLQEPI